MFEYFIVWLGCVAVRKRNRNFCFGSDEFEVKCWWMYRGKEKIYLSWHLALPTQSTGRLEQLPVDELGSAQNVLLSADWPSSIKSLPFHIYEALPFKPQERGQVEWMFAFGVRLDLDCCRSAAVCIRRFPASQSIKSSSTRTEILFGCFVSSVWTSLNFMLECSLKNFSTVMQPNFFHRRYWELSQQEKHM